MPATTITSTLVSPTRLTSKPGGGFTRTPGRASGGGRTRTVVSAAENARMVAEAKVRERLQSEQVARERAAKQAQLSREQKIAAEQKE